jgi:hypothetical protein
MARLRYDNPYNSTLFSTCCKCAVTDSETKCPVCGEEVFPDTPSARHSEALRVQMGANAYAEHCAYVAKQIAKDKEIDRRMASVG